MGCIYRKRGVLYITWRDVSGKSCFQRIGNDRALAKSTLKQLEGSVQKKKLSRRHGVETEMAPEVPLFGDTADKWLELRSALGPDGQPAIRSWRDNQTHLKHLRPR